MVFVAPTKPLVAQQIEACHRTCGIPGSHAAELTGQNPRLQRAKAVSAQVACTRFPLSHILVVAREARLLHDASDLHERSQD